MCPNEKDDNRDILLSAEMAKKAQQRKPVLFDIEKSDEEYFGAKSSAPQGDTGAPAEKQPMQPTPPIAQPTARNIEPPILPRNKPVYQPGSFKELEPDAPMEKPTPKAPPKPVLTGNEPTIAISRSSVERQMSQQSGLPLHKSEDVDGVKIYGEQKGFYDGYSSQVEPPIRPNQKPFKLNIKDADYAAIPDFDNRKVQQERAKPRVPVESRMPHEARAKAPYAAQEAGADGRKNRTMRSLGRLANGIIYTLGVLFVSILLSIFIIQSASDVMGMFKSEHEVIIDIPENADTGVMAKLLKEKGVINQPFTFKLYIKFKDINVDYKKGTYTLNSDMSYDEILLSMNAKEEVKQTVTITFIEGKSIREIADELEKNKVCRAEDFINVLQTTDFGFEFEKLIPKDENRYLRLEGYMFPDTYSFYVGEKPASAAKKFLSNFNKRITPDLIKRMDDLGWTLDQTLTLASIIQKEAGTLDEMHAVSSVFNNRLDSKGKFPMLQSDVTINYVNDNITPFVTDTAKQQTYASVYNTYKCEGLPIGPISNPGLSAIKAAIYPDDSSYYYFLTDAKMRYYYASTLAQHESNMAKAKQVGEEIGGVNTHDEK